MKAWFIKEASDLSINRSPLVKDDIDVPIPNQQEILIKVSCCGVCHTELDEIEGRTPPPVYPIIPGHQVVGLINEVGPGAERFKVGNRVGVAWIYSACGFCEFCSKGLENLCPDFKATGRDKNGGYAEYIVINEKFAFLIPSEFSDVEAA